MNLWSKRQGRALTGRITRGGTAVKKLFGVLAAVLLALVGTTITAGIGIHTGITGIIPTRITIGHITGRTITGRITPTPVSFRSAGKA
jgi:hypothetical protein